MRTSSSVATIAIAVSISPPVAAAEDSVPESALDWRWHRAEPWEYAATAVALAGAFYLRFGYEHPDPDWTGGVLADDWVRERTTLEKKSHRYTAKYFSDGMFYGAMAYRMVDDLVVAGVGWGNSETALQLSMIDLESFGFIAITLWGGQALFGRRRPYVERCDDPGFAAIEGACGSDDDQRSFYAGHPAVGMTAAGLTCTHHAHLPLYGGGAGDDLACGITIGAAVMQGYARILIEYHYASDVLVGFAMGAFAGWALPALHYAREEKPRRDARRPDKRAPALSIRSTVVPLFGNDRAGLAIIGVF